MNKILIYAQSNFVINIIKMYVDDDQKKISLGIVINVIIMIIIMIMIYNEK